MYVRLNQFTQPAVHFSKLGIHVHIYDQVIRPDTSTPTADVALKKTIFGAKLPTALTINYQLVVAAAALARCFYGRKNARILLFNLSVQ